MNTPQDTPKNELIRAFRDYCWIVAHTNPIAGILPLVEAPPGIIDRVKELELSGEVIEERNSLSSLAVNILLLRLVMKGIPLFRVESREIACMLDIRELWDKLEIKSLKDSFHYYRETTAHVMAYLAPQYRQIEKEFASKLEPGEQSENVGIPGDFVPFPTPAGTQWHEVEISFIDNENAKISAKSKTESRHYSQLGFKDKRSGIKPVKSWNILLLFGEKECLEFSHKDKEIFEKAVQDLRKRLKACFGIQDNPIILEHGYKPKFKVSIYENQSRSVHAFSNSDSFGEDD